MSENNFALPLENCMKNFHSSGFRKPFQSQNESVPSEQQDSSTQKLICLKKWYVRFLKDGNIKYGFLLGLINKASFIS